MTQDNDPGARAPADGSKRDTTAGRSPIATDTAFSRFFEESYETTVAWTLKNFKELILRVRSTAEDVVMDAFDKLYRDRLSLEDRNPVACLQTRIRTLLIDQGRTAEAAANYLSDRTTEHSDASARPADSILASRECRELFSEEAVGSLDPNERRVYDLYLEERTYQQMADSLGVSKETARWQLRLVLFKLFQAMARLTTLASPHQLAAPDDALVLRTPEHARRAIQNNLPRLLSDVVRLVHVENVPPAQVVVRLKLSSSDELAMHQKRAYHVLEILYKAKMPDALIEALAYKDPRKGRPRDE